MQGLIAAAIAQGLGVVLCMASPATAGAQQLGFAHGDESAVPAAERKTYACVDPADVLARRWLQDAPCRLPMVHLPVGAALSPQESPRWPTALPRLPEREPGHAMFWRFPVQPLGPYDAPRHWR